MAKPKTPLFLFTFAVGDDNGNGKTDVAVDVYVFGLHVSDVTKDIDFTLATDLFKGLVGLVKKAFPKLKIFGG